MGGSEKLALGVEAGGWKKNEEDVSSVLGTLHAVAYWYPTPNKRRYFLKGGIGAVAYKADDRVEEGEDDADPFRSDTFGAQLGIGYQFRISQSISFNPYLTMMGSLKADLKQGNTRAPSASLTWIQLWVAIGWR